MPLHSSLATEQDSVSKNYIYIKRKEEDKRVRNEKDKKVSVREKKVKSLRILLAAGAGGREKSSSQAGPPFPLRSGAGLCLNRPEQERAFLSSGFSL